jgi:hypothetical protein
VTEFSEERRDRATAAELTRLIERSQPRGG